MAIDSSYRQALDAARANMSRLLQQRENIDKEVKKLAAAIDSLAILCEEVPQELSFPGDSDAFAVNLRDAVRMVFKAAAPQSLTPTQVRDKLRESGFHLDRYVSELPPIHNTILRLLSAGELEEDVPTREGRVFKWVSSLTRALRDTKKETWVSRAADKRPLTHNFRPTGTTGDE